MKVDQAISPLFQIQFLICCVGFLGLTACDSNRSSGFSATSCDFQQNLETVFFQVINEAPTIGGKKQLLIKLSEMEQDYDEFQAQMDSEYEAESSLRVSKISEDTVAVELPQNDPFSDVIARFIAEQKISDIEPDFQVSAIFTQPSSQEDFISLKTKAASEAEVEAQTETSPQTQQVIVAIVDSGVDYIHKDLANYMWKNPHEIPGNGIDDDQNGFVDDIHGWDFANNDNDPMADDSPSYHGTHVAGIVQQVVQLSQQNVDVKLMALKFLGSSGSGKTSDAIRAIDYAIKNKALVLNNSWGSPNFSSSLFEAIERARVANVLFIASAGNGDSNGNGINIDEIPFYPAGYPHRNIISVAATDSGGVKTAWSNFGISRVDVGAPGLKILSTLNGDSYGYLSGTSMAAPYVSGVAALLWSQRPELFISEIARIILNSGLTTESLKGKVLTGTMVSQAEAVKYASTYVHNPNETGMPAVSPYTSCPP